MARDSERRKFFRGPLWEGPNFCKFCITPTTDFIGYFKENLKIDTGSPPFLPSLTHFSSSPCLPLPLPFPPFLYPTFP